MEDRTMDREGCTVEQIESLAPDGCLVFAWADAPPHPLLSGVRNHVEIERDEGGYRVEVTTSDDTGWVHTRAEVFASAHAVHGALLSV
jgi:hypothetical protein